MYYMYSKLHCPKPSQISALALLVRPRRLLCTRASEIYVGTYVHTAKKVQPLRTFCDSFESVHVACAVCTISLVFLEQKLWV